MLHIGRRYIGLLALAIKRLFRCVQFFSQPDIFGQISDRRGIHLHLSRHGPLDLGLSKQPSRSSNQLSIYWHRVTVFPVRTATCGAKAVQHRHLSSRPSILSARSWRRQNSTCVRSPLLNSLTICWISAPVRRRLLRRTSCSSAMKLLQHRSAALTTMRLD